MTSLSKTYGILCILLLIVSCQKEPIIFPEQEDPTFVLSGSADSDIDIMLAAGVNGYDIAYLVPEGTEDITHYSGLVAGPDCIDDCQEKLEFFYTYNSSIIDIGSSLEFITSDGVEDLVEDEKLKYRFSQEVTSGPEPTVKLLQGVIEDVDSQGVYEFCLRILAAMAQPWLEVTVKDFMSYTIHPGMPDLVTPCTLKITSFKPDDGGVRTLSIYPSTDAEINWIDSDGNVTTGNDFKLTDNIKELTVQIIGSDCFVDIKFDMINVEFRESIEYSFSLEEIKDPITSGSNRRFVKIAYTDPAGQMYVSSDGSTVELIDIMPYAEEGLIDELISYNVVVNCTMINLDNAQDSLNMGLAGQLLSRPF